MPSSASRTLSFRGYPGSARLPLGGSLEQSRQLCFEQHRENRRPRSSPLIQRSLGRRCRSSQQHHLMLTTMSCRHLQKRLHRLSHRRRRSASLSDDGGRLAAKPATVCSSAAGHLWQRPRVIVAEEAAIRQWSLVARPATICSRGGEHL
jgi:hypothetical protein